MRTLDTHPSGEQPSGVRVFDQLLGSEPSTRRCDDKDVTFRAGEGDTRRLERCDTHDGYEVSVGTEAPHLATPIDGDPQVILSVAAHAIRVAVFNMDERRSLADGTCGGVVVTHPNDVAKGVDAVEARAIARPGEAIRQAEPIVNRGDRPVMLDPLQPLLLISLRRRAGADEESAGRVGLAVI